MQAISADFFLSLCGYMYNFYRSAYYFAFEYVLIGHSEAISFSNPFTGELVSYNLPSFGDGFIGGLVVDSIERFFDISLSVTFFDILTGPLLFVVLGYAVFKFLNPVT